MAPAACRPRASHIVGLIALVFLPPLQSLLVRDPAARLGSGPTDVEEVKSHKFFSNINFEALERREVSAAPCVRTAEKVDTDASPLSPSFLLSFLSSSQIPPPWRPNVASDLDLRNIDQDFVNEPVPGSVMHQSVENLISVNVSDAFHGFSYNAGADGALAQ
jgi:hypothetical protein